MLILLELLHCYLQSSLNFQFIGHTRDLISVPIAEVAKGPVTEELEADLVIKRDVKAEIKRKQKRKTGSEEKRRTNITPR